MTNSHLVIAGHCTIDDILGADGRILPATPGGAAAYATLGAVMYGARVVLVSRVGDDYPLDRFRDSLRTCGDVDTTRVRRVGPRSIHNIIRYEADGARRCDVESWDLMEEETPTVADLPPEFVRDAIVLLTPGSLDTQLETVLHLRALGRPVIADTELHYFPDDERKELLRTVIAQATCFLPSIEHLRVLFDGARGEIESYLDRVPGLGCPWVIVKQGVRGSMLIDCDGSRAWHVPAVEDLAVRDVTGAGDGFSGGFAAALCDGRDHVDAACWGTVTASFVVESIGAVLPPHFNRDLAVRRYGAVRDGVREVCGGRGWGGTAREA